MSSSKKQYTHKERKQFAERHGDLIISMMRKFDTYDKLGPAQQNRNGKFEFKHVLERKWTGGLYMFYLVPKKETNRKLPIYVGQTMRAFSYRFKDKDLNHVFEWFDPDEFYLYAVVCGLTNPQASFMKAMFLDVFNFIGNSVGSDYKRKDLDYDVIYSREESWEIVKEKWKYIKFDLADVVGKVEYMRSED